MARIAAKALSVQPGDGGRGYKCYKHIANVANVGGLRNLKKQFQGKTKGRANIKKMQTHTVYIIVCYDLMWGCELVEIKV